MNCTTSDNQSVCSLLQSDRSFRWSHGKKYRVYKQRNFYWSSESIKRVLTVITCPLNCVIRWLGDECTLAFDRVVECCVPVVDSGLVWSAREASQVKLPGHTCLSADQNGSSLKCESRCPVHYIPPLYFYYYYCNYSTTTTTTNSKELFFLESSKLALV